MSDLNSTEGLEILNAVREILLKNESPKGADEELTTCNVDSSSTVAEPNTRLGILQTRPDTLENLKPVLDALGPDSSHSETPIAVAPSGKNSDTSSLDYVPFFYGQSGRPRALIKMAELACKGSIGKRTTAFMVVPKTGFAWKEVPNEASWFKPTQTFMKGGVTTPISNKNFHKILELVAHIDDKWCYMGSFKATAWTTLDSNGFLALSIGTQDRIIAQTALGKIVRRQRDFRSMYVSGELSAVQIDIRRVGFNTTICKCLLDAAETLRASGKLQGTGRDESDESQDDN